jgi:membrane dipeptidase
MLIIDAHLDLSWNALQWNRDLKASVYTTRGLENTMTEKGRGIGTVAFPEMRKGRVFLSFATMLARSTGRVTHHIDYADPSQSYGIAMGQLAYYRALEFQGEAKVITNKDELNAHTAAWQAWENAGATGNTPPLGFVLSMEGADPILAPEQLEEWWNAGLRLLGITHYGPGRYAGGTGTELGLTEIGKPLLKEMERLGMVLDVTHCSDESFWEALEIYGGPILASHQNCRALVPKQRQFSDEQIRAVIERDGVLGAALDTWMLSPEWIVTSRPNPNNPRVTMENVVDHIDHICQLAGNTRHAAIGTDLDGGFGLEQSPSDYDTIADLQKFNELLAKRGYSESDIAAILHGNWLRLLNRVWSK